MVRDSIYNFNYNYDPLYVYIGGPVQVYVELYKDTKSIYTDIIWNLYISLIKRKNDKSENFPKIKHEIRTL